METIKNFKDFSDVKIGDSAMENPYAGGVWDNELGKVVWKGSAEDVFTSKYKEDLVDWEEVDTLNDLKETGGDEYVAVDLPVYGKTLFVYDGDPCSTVVFK